MLEVLSKNEGLGFPFWLHPVGDSLRTGGGGHSSHLGGALVLPDPGQSGGFKMRKQPEGFGRGSGSLSGGQPKVAANSGGIGYSVAAVRIPTRFSDVPVDCCFGSLRRHRPHVALSDYGKTHPPVGLRQSDGTQPH